jgi:hypothetical protein
MMKTGASTPLMTTVTSMPLMTKASLSMELTDLRLNRLYLFR